LNKIGSQLAFVEVEQGYSPDARRESRADLLDRLSRGKITVADALEKLKER